MGYPKTVGDYWELSREEREELFQKDGFGWRTITQGIWHTKDDQHEVGESPKHQAKSKVRQDEKTAIDQLDLFLSQSKGGFEN